MSHKLQIKMLLTLLAPGGGGGGGGGYFVPGAWFFLHNF